MLIELAVGLVALLLFLLAAIAFDVWQVRNAKAQAAAETSKASDAAAVNLSGRMQDASAASDPEVLKGLDNATF